MNPFSLYISLATAIGLTWMIIDSGASEKPRAYGVIQVIDRAVIVLGLALVGGRLGYVVVHTAYFSAHPLEGLQIWLGGLSGAGAILGGVIGVMVTSAVGRVSMLAQSDQLSRTGALLAAASWLGCWQTGSAYGQLANGWFALPTMDEWGSVQARLPVQLVGAAAALAWMAFLDWQSAGKGRWQAGRKSAFWLIGMGSVMAALSLLRGDPALVWNGLRVDTWGGLMVSLAGLVWLLLSLAHQLAPDETD